MWPVLRFLGVGAYVPRVKICSPPLHSLNRITSSRVEVDYLVAAEVV